MKLLYERPPGGVYFSLGRLAQQLNLFLYKQKMEPESILLPIDEYVNYPLLTGDNFSGKQTFMNIPIEINYSKQSHDFTGI